MSLGIQNLVYGTIAVVIAVILVSNVAMPVLKGASTTNWSTSEVAIYGVAGILLIVGLLFVIGRAFGVFG